LLNNFVKFLILLNELNKKIEKIKYSKIIIFLKKEMKIISTLKKFQKKNFLNIILIKNKKNGKI